MSRQAQANAGLVVVAMIWGAGFIPQKLAMESMGPHTFNMLRFAFALLVLLPLVFLRRSHYAHREYRLDKNSGSLLVPALLLGVLLFCGSALQQIGLVYTTVADRKSVV